jgi:MFS transporter, NNP family, nitrate/nitrite transporter
LPPADQTGPRRALGYSLGPLLLLTGIFFLNFCARLVMAPLMPRVEQSLGLSHAQAGSLFLPLALGYFATLLGSGFVASRLTHRGSIILSALATGVALMLLSLAGGLWGMAGGMFLVGLAAGLYLPSGLATLTSMVPAERWGRALAVHEMAPNLGFVVAPLLAMGLLQIFAWRGVMVCLGAVALVGGLGFWRWGQGGDFAGTAPDLKSLRALLGLPGFWIMILCFGLGLGASLGIYNMLPLYLVNERGFSPQRADLLISASRLSGVAMAFVSGWASDRLGPRAAMAWVLGLCGALTVGLGAAREDWLVPLLFLQPMVAVCFFPPGFAALARLGSAAVRPVAVSLTMPLAFVLGGGALPAFIGYMGGWLSFGWGISLAGALMLAGPLLLRRLSLSPTPR